MIQLGRPEDLIEEIKEILLSDVRYASDDWDAFSLVVTLEDNLGSMNGYVYRGEEWEVRSPEDDAYSFGFEIEELRDAMKTEAGARWKQALIQCWKPGPEFNFQFDWQGAKPWSYKKTKEEYTPDDYAEYVKSLRPPPRD